ncbi:hypothetical protein [Vibrio cholerae]|nr:hypothetical protein [Vibrio cholerae]GHW88250.1 hypothetical protein VCSRO154_3414 [Vibrio metoecus]EGR0013199.1 hypothetical protein [Vibrio cholerae]EGR1349414.1 hypothetical protein [Vibrio cholerae]EGR2472342.1 hypothetical protein [Vibrio cholerae]EGR3952404.1 hypothetical protein [Vibrio cholerae]
MKAKLLSGFMILNLVGCSSPMPDTHYQNFSSFVGHIQKCFEAEYIDSQMYAEAKNAFSYVLSTWDYDSTKLSKMINESYSITYVTQASCRQTQADAYQLIANVKQHRVNQKESQQAWDNAMEELNKNKPVYCNTIGTMTICN